MPLLPVLGSTCLSWVSYILVSVTLAFRFQALGIGVVPYGAVVAVFALGMLLTESIWGAYAFRIAGPLTISGLGAVVAAVLWGVGASRTPAEFAVTMGLLGALMVFPVPLLRWWAVTARGPSSRGSGSARYAVGTGGGIVIGSAVGPVVYFAFGFERLVLLAIAVWIASLALLLPIPWSRVASVGAPVRPFRQMRRVLTPAFGVAAALVTLLYVCSTLTTNFVQYYSVVVFGGSPVAAGYVIGLARATALVAGLLLGTVVDRWGPIRSAPFGFALIGLGALATYVAPTYLAMLAATVVFSVGVGWLGAVLLPLALLPAPPDLQGTTIGVFGSFEDLGLLIGPALLGSVYAAFGPRSMFLTVATVAAIGLAGAMAIALRGSAPRVPQDGLDRAGLAADSAAAPPGGR